MQKFWLIILSCMFMSFSSSTITTGAQDPVVQFWTWFRLNEKRLYDYPTKPAERLGEIHLQLQKISPGLIVEADLTQRDQRNIVFSADGNEDLFFAVENIVKKAPQLSGWHFVAFRQRVPATEFQSLKVENEHIQLHVKDMKFFPVTDSDSLDIIIYSKNLTVDNYSLVATYSFQLLDLLLGEYDAAKKVRAYDFHEMPTDKKELLELRPLIQLPNFIDSFHKVNN